jgi:hypothetical protein
MSTGERQRLSGEASLDDQAWIDLEQVLEDGFKYTVFCS